MLALGKWVGHAPSMEPPTTLRQNSMQAAKGHMGFGSLQLMHRIAPLERTINLSKSVQGPKATVGSHKGALQPQMLGYKKV